MKPTLADELRQEIDKLESEFVILCGITALGPDGERRMAEIQAALTRLRHGVQQLIGPTARS